MDFVGSYGSLDEARATLALTSVDTPELHGEACSKPPATNPHFAQSREDGPTPLAPTTTQVPPFRTRVIFQIEELTSVCCHYSGGSLAVADAASVPPTIAPPSTHTHAAVQTDTEPPPDPVPDMWALRWGHSRGQLAPRPASSGRPPCEGCGVAFSVLTRRHMCRVCRLHYCGECARSRPILKSFGVSTVVLICDACLVSVRQALTLRLEHLQAQEHTTRKALHALFDQECLELQTRAALVLCEAAGRDMLSTAWRRCWVSVGGLLIDPRSPYKASALKDAALAEVASDAADREARDHPIDSDGPVWVDNANGFTRRVGCCKHPGPARAEEVNRLLARWPALGTRVQLRELVVQHGCPNECRAQLWWVVSGVEEVRRARSESYAELLRRPVSQQTIDDIARDVHRTFKAHALFRDEPPEASLFNVMRAFSALRPDIGYCQGMSFIVATLCIYFPDPERAFWMMVTLFERYGIAGLYDLGFPRVLALCASAECLMPPALRQHLAEAQVPVSSYAINWMLTLFTASFGCWEAVMMAWDYLFLSRPSALVLFRLLVAIHSRYSSHMLQCPDIFSLMSLMQRRIPHREVHRQDMQELLQAKELSMRLPVWLPFLQLQTESLAPVGGPGVGSAPRTPVQRPLAVKTLMDAPEGFVGDRERDPCLP